MDHRDMKASENNPKAERAQRKSNGVGPRSSQSILFLPDWSVRYWPMTKLTFSEPQFKIRKVLCGSPLGTKCSSNGGAISNRITAWFPIHAYIPSVNSRVPSLVLHEWVWLTVPL